MTWTHALLTHQGDLVGVAKDIETNDFGTFGTAYFIGLEIPEEVYTVLDRFEIQDLSTSDAWFRKEIEAEVHAAGLVLG